MPSLLIRGGKFHGVTSNPTEPLHGINLAHLPCLENGFLLTEHGIIQKIGPIEEAPSRADQIIDAHGKHILPCWCDSHSHVIFAKSREEEFVYRIKGMSYEEIAAKGGGILNSADRLRELPESVLFEQASVRLHEVISLGTGALEIKSGYGLTTESELKMLRVIRKLKEAFPIPIKATFLGAHAIPREFKSNREAYVRLIIEKMIPKVADEGLADYIDVFCDRGFFDVDESERIIGTGVNYGLKPKIHVSELANIGGVQLGLKYGALSVDHLECAGSAEIDALSISSTIATLLPSCAFFMNLEYAPARALIDSGAAVALATDYNPGTAPSGSMPFVISLACLKMRMLPEEAINAATVNGAYAMELQDLVGVLAPGMFANVIVTKPMPSLAYLPYAFGSTQIDQVVIRGKVFI
ncbi:MAG TPA: imidazolonepropionase [Saprospiraceae bacterium]|nr:imidazolonepropionase [Saprospiraceae bacterium]